MDYNEVLYFCGHTSLLVPGWALQYRVNDLLRDVQLSVLVGLVRKQFGVEQSIYTITDNSHHVG